MFSVMYIVPFLTNTCDNVPVHSATEWTASVHTAHMSKPVIYKVRVHIATEWTASVHTSHMSKPVINVRVHNSATQSTASVHTSHMSKPVISFVFIVLRNQLPRYILHTCPNL